MLALPAMEDVMRRLVSYALVYLLAAATAQAGEAVPLQVRIGYLGYRPDPGPLLSNVIAEPSDAGLRGAELAIIDSNSTGRFLKHDYRLESANVDSPQALLEAARAQHEQGLRLFVVNAPGESLRQLSAALPDSLLFNAGSPDDTLRTTDCLGNVLHTLPDRATLADALIQFSVVRKWQRALLIVGQTPEDQAYAAALRRAMKRFGMKIVAEKAWQFDNEYVPYQTWFPRPVAGTQGLTPTGWHKTVETYGAAQLQKRFEALAGRWMNDRDFAAWIAVRSIAAAVSKLRQDDPFVIRQLALGDQLPLDGFKGRKLSYRPWNGQLRQPIPLVQPRALVSTSPQDGFLHPSNEMDSLGFDQPEVSCRYP
jgi:ABC-type branched-subunit amino acid transport system substrate-binding protein